MPACDGAGSGGGGRAAALRVGRGLGGGVRLGLVSRVGFEPTTPGLKVRCSSAELTALGLHIVTPPFSLSIDSGFPYPPPGRARASPPRHAGHSSGL